MLEAAILIIDDHSERGHGLSSQMVEIVQRLVRSADEKNQQVFAKWEKAFEVCKHSKWLLDGTDISEPAQAA